MATRFHNVLGLLARYWFPLALLGLLLLGLPGFLLFFLNLLGYQGEINTWLEDTFRVTYHIPVIWWLALLLLLVPLAIVLLYFLKLKRKPLAVPSTFLWKKSIEDLHVNSLLQWLRQNVLLLLQLLTVLFLIYALMGFRFHGNPTRGKRYILFIDNSASMAATDVEPNRLEAAKEEALKVIRGYSDDDLGMVVVFNSQVETLQRFTPNRAKLENAVKSIEPTHRTTRIDQVLRLADSLANRLRSPENEAVRPEGEEAGKERQYVPVEGIPTEMHLFSDGRFRDLSDADLAGLNTRIAGNESPLGDLHLHYHLAGKPGPENVNNIGIVAMSAVRLSGNASLTDPRSGNALQVFLKVRNYCPRPVTARLRLEKVVVGRRSPVGQRSLRLKARQVGSKDGLDRDEPGEAAATFDLTDLDERVSTVLHAYLANPGDQFPLDDDAWLVVGVVRKAQVLIVGSANPFLDAFFNHPATRRVADVTRLTPADLNGETYREAARDGTYDLVIFDRCGPATRDDLPQANTFFIDRPPPPWQRPKDEFPDPVVTGWMKNDTLLRHLTGLWDIVAQDAFRFDLRAEKVPPGTRALIESGQEAALLFSMPRGPFIDLVLTFPLVNDKGELTTNWVVLPSFPLFFRNVLYNLGKVGDAVREKAVQPGEPMVLRPEPRVKQVTVIPPRHGGPPRVNKKTLRRDARAGFLFGETERLGVYRVERDDGATQYFAVNLLDPLESNIQPREQFMIGSESVKPDQPRRQPREIWWWVVLLALALLVVEWYIYNRRLYL
jgi:hypothetical protein